MMRKIKNNIEKNHEILTKHIKIPENLQKTLQAAGEELRPRVLAEEDVPPSDDDLPQSVSQNVTDVIKLSSRTATPRPLEKVEEVLSDEQGGELQSTDILFETLYVLRLTDNDNSNLD